MLDLQKRRVQLMLFVIGLIALSMTAEKFRQLVGEEAASKSGKFTFLNCFDMGTGTLACTVKESVKLYVYSLRSAHVERARLQAIEKALTDALKEGLAATDAAKQAQKVGAKAAKLASRQAKRILGPMISSGWDFFEAVYFGGTMTEGFLRGTGTLLGTYAGGFHGEQRMGKLGYLMGSHLGSWVGGRVGLMVYDVVNGVNFLLQFVQPEDEYSSSEESEYKTEEKFYYNDQSEETGYYEG
ncbi:uncharacterized protein LOC109724461 [Ananas comosus]|uniref:Uncharacterized protein LOC109724461 n=1 Tax=Ananas comosus TaxID=4615 RepID=A0A199UYA3_ANACO|nr:uncharacterized protein LOC109724461 [Ananas comosus]OAY69758.1 hypothetical protein ACMD2_11031 [Ananas comosus]